MTDNLTNWIATAGSFNAHIHCYVIPKFWDSWSKRWKKVFPFEGLPDIQDRPPYSPVHLSEGSSLGEGWLIAGGGGTPTTFKIIFDSQTPNRLYVRIKGSGSTSNRQVEISRNGYLGLYRGDAKVDLLKLEPLKWTPDTLRCRIRDHLGHTVKLVHSDQIYLNAQNGDDTTFLITRQQ
ncbi:hypothetical protein DQ397_003602 [Pseudomonas sp. CK-NBRI-02]|uniref:hypothetical protein n=1 Tax=Pseudomonas sp. CK-NBRI-02 TaxID=2249759 RepID=UPI0006932CA1|nr:hypothetical protein [Pseudomonas sp. CK-NBRI-02]TYO71716.1 hypothetical protein DQ397_003602 [Pseudomonas sp. CK-NBRI-02]